MRVLENAFSPNIFLSPVPLLLKKSLATSRQFAHLGYVPFRDDYVGRVEGGKGTGLVLGEGAGGTGGGRAEGRRRNHAAARPRLGLPIRFAATDDFPAQFGNPFTSLLCISFTLFCCYWKISFCFCFTMSYTAIF